MWYLLYNVALLIAAPVMLAVLLAKQRCRQGLPQRLGFGKGLSSLSGVSGRDRPVIWIHAVSLGEVVAVTPLVNELHRRHPAYRLVVST
ncbi:MAG: glycosyltransferase N-terminal domain-containing protein, partial [Nitrospiraceae bacterium]